MNKVMYVANTNTLAFILSQERQHWLLKTDKIKQIQDDVTGDLFEGKVDNRGSEITVSTEKLPYKTTTLSDIKFKPSGIEKIITPAYSALTYSSSMNGLMFARIESMSYPYTIDDVTDYKNYKIEFVDAEEIIVPFGGSTSTGDVYATRWIKTTTKPRLLILDNDGVFNIETIDIEIDDTNVVYYYPLDTNLQILKMHRTGVGVYSSDMVNSDVYIGYPLFWFTCDISDSGPTTIINNNYSEAGKQLAFIGNKGNESRYNAEIYFGIAGNMDATPDDTESVNWILRVYSATDTEFANNSNDVNCKLDIESIELYNSSTDQTHKLNIDPTDIDYITISDFSGWTYVSPNMYACQMADFDVNTFAISHNPLISALNIKFKSNIPFFDEMYTKDIGYAGLELTSALDSDQTRYPFKLDEFDGIPEWFKENRENGTPQHATLYAIHNTPFYSENVPESRQIAALLLDPGIQALEDSTELGPDEKGRVYVLSNDPAEYENNATAKNPKPPRTAARICDIPTAITQFMNIDGLVPVSVVDKKYVRSQASFKTEDLERLYNTLGSRVVTPKHVTTEGIPVYEANPNQDNKYIFNGVDTLNEVDLINYANSLRIMTNLNPVVDPQNIKISSIIDPGQGYAINDRGIIIIGGCSMDYIVEEVDEDGAVTKVLVVPTNNDIPINLSNFDMDDNQSGLTKAFGSSRSGGTGEGLKVSFIIQDYKSILTKPGKLKDDLIAFVKDLDGLHLYTYIPSENTMYGEDGKWIKDTTISEFEVSVNEKDKGGVSTKNAFLNNTIPSFKPITVFDENDNVRKSSVLKTLSTSSMVNIIDTDNTPIMEFGGEIQNQLNNIDICGIRGDYLREATAKNKEATSVIDTITEKGYGMYDSYLVWRWVKPTDPYDKRFVYGFITRSFNNWLTTDLVTLIPKNDLLYNNFVNTNPNTTIVWDVKDVGPMMWIYSPEYDKHEKYRIDSVSKELVIEYDSNNANNTMSWNTIDIRSSESENTLIPITQEYGNVLDFNLCSNSIVDCPEFKPTDAIYSQPKYRLIATVGTSIDDIPKPRGNWRLVFPRVNTFTVKTVTENDNGEYTSISTVPELKLKMLHAIRGSDLPFDSSKDTITVKDSSGYDVSKNCVFINQEQNTIKMRMVNNANKWDII